MFNSAQQHNFGNIMLMAIFIFNYQIFRKIPFSTLSFIKFSA
jgi:hypothetical protein